MVVQRQTTSYDASHDEVYASPQNTLESGGVLVSIVVPAYNAGAYLRETVESIVLDAYPYREVIVVNDGSTDDTPAIAAKTATPSLAPMSNAPTNASVKTKKGTT
mgnify:CR=1 FL=1